MVTAHHRDAARIGAEVLQKGGNAVDAAVTSAFAIGVLLPVWSGIGGGGVMVVRLDEREGGAINFTMQAPALAGEDMYVLEEKRKINPVSRRFSFPAVRDNANTEGYTSIATPGALAGLCKALEKWGTIDLDQALQPAIELAEKGHLVGSTFVLELLDYSDVLTKHELSAKLFFPDNMPLKLGARLIQADYGKTLKKIAKEGKEVFYRGEIAELICHDIEKKGGFLRYEDMAQYEPVVYDSPLSISYHGFDISTVPGPCGGPTVLEILNILKNFDLSSMKPQDPDYLHILIEALKLSGVDRFTFLGDSAITGFPIEVLTTSDYGKSRAESINRNEAGQFEAGDPWRFSHLSKPENFPLPAGLSPDKGTTHISVVDKRRNAVSLTQTNQVFSGVLNPGVGVMMNSGMGWFCPIPGTVNSPKPRAWCLNNMAPVIVYKDGQVKLVAGASGGRQILSAMAQVIINYINFNMPLQAAVEAPRLHVETDDPMIDPRFGEDVTEELRRRCHNVFNAPEVFLLWPFGEPNGICVKGRNLFSGVSPLAKPGHGAGY